jgi:hypothetical protein
MFGPVAITVAALWLMAPRAYSQTLTAPNMFPANMHLLLAAAEAGQPAPRRQIRPYIDHWHNADGSNRYSAMAGVGVSVPVMDTVDNFGPGYHFEAGAGRYFNRKVGFSLRFGWDTMSLQNKVLGQLLPVYQAACGFDCTGSPVAEIFGSSHTLSLTINPELTIIDRERSKVYLIVGAGFFHKTSNFSAPAAKPSCPGCAQISSDETFDKYTSNAPGYGGGVGMTRTVSRYSPQRFYIEARFIYIDSQPKAYSADRSMPGFNVFPANSRPSKYIPITAGLRW